MSPADHEDVERSYTIYVNTREAEVNEREISFQEVVEIAFPDAPTGPNIIYTVTYRRGHGSKPEGSLTKGGSVKLKDGMIFNVTRTDRS